MNGVGSDARRRLITVSMPPGVEHSERFGAEAVRGLLLITVSMPPGVEHMVNVVHTAEPEVITVSMPPGVEHWSRLRRSSTWSRV